MNNFKWTIFLISLFFFTICILSAAAVDFAEEDEDAFSDLWNENNVPKLEEFKATIKLEKCEPGGDDGQRNSNQSHGKCLLNLVKKEEPYENDQMVNEKYSGKFGQNSVKLEENEDERIKYQNEKEYSENGTVKTEQNDHEAEVEEADDQSTSDQNEKRRKIYSDDQKRAQIDKFEWVKNEYFNKKRNSNKTPIEIECKIAKKIGTSRTSIYKWKKQFELDYETINSSEEQNRKTKEKYLKLKAKKEKYLEENEEEQIKYKNEKEFPENGTIKTEQSYDEAEVEETDDQSNQKEKRKYNYWSDAQKRALIDKFEWVKNEYFSKKRNSNKKVEEIEYKIAKKIGTGRTSIYKWKKQFNYNPNNQKFNIYSNEEKIALIEKFEMLKKEYLRLNPNLNIPIRQIEFKIGRKIGSCCSLIYKWKKQFGYAQKACSGIYKVTVFIKKKKFHTEEQKHEIVEKYKELKADGSLSDGRIAAILGLKKTTLSSWKQKFGLKVKTNYTKEKRLEIISKYYKIKRKHPTLNKAEIAKILNVGVESIRIWGNEFKRKIDAD